MHSLEQWPFDGPTDQPNAVVTVSTTVPVIDGLKNIKHYGAMMYPYACGHITWPKGLRYLGGNHYSRVNVSAVAINAVMSAI